jgi:hypothetical protein
MTPTLLIAQRRAVSAGELVERTAARLSELDLKGKDLRFALLACTDSSDGCALPRAHETRGRHPGAPDPEVLQPFRWPPNLAQACGRVTISPYSQTAR